MSLRTGSSRMDRRIGLFSVRDRYRNGTPQDRQDAHPGHHTPPGDPHVELVDSLRRLGPASRERSSDLKRSKRGKSPPF